MLEATVATDLSITGWALAIVTESDTKEVRLTTSGTPRQDKIRLLIGKITLDGSAPTAWQSLYTSV
ncbi:hypothetical protein, partial [Mesorhizobium sp. WSM4989]|uniref:hypothetical protein n=1 Tax=Mesorhizobium sp. WSM4989 TaxID=3038541 RepID=UPI002416D032